MDLENFDDLENAARPPPSSNVSSANDAVEEFDRGWYIPASRAARWMDLLGDYAGSEAFLIDGESLLAIILDDPLLAIARGSEPSFQILHAYHSLERTLLQFTQRSASFEVVFWNATRHSTILTGQSSFKVASRILARTLLFKHLLTLDKISVHTFEDLEDPLWIEYEAAKKPMFMLVNDGGIFSNSRDSLTAECVLAQRIFIFDVLSRGTSIALLKGAEYRDSKILSFVYEQRRNRDHRGRFSDQFWTRVHQAKVSLDTRLREQSFSVELKPLSTRLNLLPCTNGSFLRQLGQKYFSKMITGVPPELFYLLIIHFAILPSLSVRERARPLEQLNSGLLDIVANKFFPSVFCLLEDLVGNLDTSVDIDGRVFISLLRFCMTQPVTEMRDLFGKTVYELAGNIWTDIKGPSLDFLAFAARFPLPSSSTPVHSNTAPQDMEPFRLLPFDNEVFNGELSAVHVPIGKEELQISSNVLDFDNGGVFADTQHWHNQKAILPSHMGGTVAKPTDERRRRRELRSNQRFMATLQTQAATLTGASGAILQQIIITPVGAKKSSKAPPRNRPQPTVKENKSGKTKAQKLSSADKLRQKINEEKLSSEETISQKWWRDQLTLTFKMTLSEKVAHMHSISRNKKMGEKLMGLEMRLYRLHLEFLQWIEEPERESDSIRDRYTVLILRTIKEICDQDVITPTAAKALTAALSAIGFSDYAAELVAPVDDSSDRQLNFDFVKLVKSKTKSLYHKFMPITEHPVEWQLRVFGEFMDRSMDSAPDHRVSFQPDAWQRRVLDCIDDDQSLLVVAPTSAGKTFISYYAMEKILRDSDDGILVYIAPTKALVSQIAAEVYARFSKSLNGKSCWAIHTRDYRVHDPQKCQILVTVPEMLAIMLLSPPLARVWTSRIKRIILDEVHSIGQQEGGAVWEQIILLAPCPIIGLSATIGSPEIFNEWLKTVQEAHGYKHTFIEHPHRYSHLRKFFYTFNGEPQFQSLDTYKASSRARFIHPVSVLAFGARNLPSDLSLESRDALDLYRALVSHQHWISRDLDELNPTVFFSHTRGLLRQKDILAYESQLKAILSSLLVSHDPKDASSPLNGIIHEVQDSMISKMSSDTLNVAPSRNVFRKNLIFLLADLHVKGELPAILFDFDRANCEIMAQDIVTVLQVAEESWRASNSEWQAKLRMWENWKLRSKERERLTDKAKKQKKDIDSTGADATETRSWESTFNPDDPIQQFSFAGVRTSYSKVDLDSDVEEIAKWTSTPMWALDALRRGVAVHHSGMNRRYRSLVESLFRVGFVRVVIATGTLALGINAPAKTSVFCGDSPYLTALMYRQCAGRAGRRGYDLLGNVVFYGLPMERVQRLVLSRLPSLSGNFPLTSTLTLRLLNLLEGSNYAPVAVNAVRSIMALPHISFGSEVGKHQLLHHLRFSIEYLRRSSLVNEEGKPMNLFAIAAHLYYTEPSNLALVTLLRNGVLHQICKQKSFTLAKRDFILLMCHLFGRRYLSKVLTNKKYLMALVSKYPSVIVLPPLSEDARNVLIQHDREILRIFTGYAIAYGAEYGAQIGHDSKLPLSGVEFLGCDDGVYSGFRAHLSATSISTTARSVFVATSGHDDNFGSVSELASTARDGLHLNAHAIPSMEHLTATSDGDDGSFEHVLNAYLLDFYTHGQVPTLASANGIRRGDVWYLLQDFTLTLATVKAALEQLLLKSSREAASKKESEEPEKEFGDDDRYESFDPAEMEQGDDGGNGDDHEGFKRPSDVEDRDWKVYEVVREALKEFEGKFRAMWA